MSSAPPSQPSSSRPSRRVVAIAVAILVLAAVVIGVILVLTLFFGSDAPDAPTLDDALQVLTPSIAPSE